VLDEDQEVIGGGNDSAASYTGLSSCLEDRKRSPLRARAQHTAALSQPWYWC
jgi:hypothetical protein